MGDQPLTRYLVELDRRSDGWAELQAVTAQARAAADGVNVRFLRAIFVPEDGTCFFLYEAGSADAVRAAGRRAQLAIARIDESVRIAQDQEVTP